MEETQEEYLKNSEELKVFNGLGGFRLPEEQFDARIAEMAARRRMTLEKVKATPKPSPLYSRGETVILWRDGINVICAPVKTGKTSVISLMVLNDMTSRVLWIDGEQNDIDAAETYRRLLFYSGVGPNGELENLDYLNLVEEARDDRLDIVRYETSYFKPDVIVIDGLQQLMKDQDNELAAADLLDTINRTAAGRQASVICSVQASRTSVLNKMPSIKGHLGSMAQERAVQVLMLEKKEGGRLVLEIKASRRQGECEPFILDKDTEGRLHWNDLLKVEDLKTPPTVPENILGVFRELMRTKGQIVAADIRDCEGVGKGRNAPGNYLKSLADPFAGGMPDVRYPLERRGGSTKTVYYILKPSYRDDEDQENTQY